MNTSSSFQEKKVRKSEKKCQNDACYVSEKPNKITIYNFARVCLTPEVFESILLLGKPADSEGEAVDTVDTDSE